MRQGESSPLESTDRPVATRAVVWCGLAWHGVAVGSAIVLLIVGIVRWVYVVEFERRREAVENELISLVEGKLRAVEGWQWERLSDGRHFAGIPAQVSAMSAVDAKALGDAAMVRWMKSLCLKDEYSAAFLFDGAGHLRLAVPEGVSEPEPAEVELARDVSNGEPVLLRDRPGHFAESGPGVDLAVRLRGSDVEGSDAGRVGVLVLRCDTSRFIAMLLGVWPRPAMRGQTVLASRVGEVVSVLAASGSPSGLIREPAMAAVPGSDTAALFDSASPGVAFQTDPTGTRVLTLVRSVPGLPWHLVGRVGIWAVEGPARGHAISASLLGLVGVIICAFSWGQGRRRRQMDRMTQELAMRREKQSVAERRELLNRTLVEHLPLRIYIKDGSSVYTSCNAIHARVLGTTPELVVGRSDNDFWPPEVVARERSEDQRVLTLGEVLEVDDRFETEAGTVWTHTIKVPYHEPSGRVVGVLAIGEDVTRRMQMEQALRASLDEKNALLKEVHHRVKNNLQIVNSLLHLQSSRLGHAGAVEAFQSTEDRVRSMALLHETLYRSGNVARADVPEYVERLCSHLRRSCGVKAANVKIVQRVDPIQLDLDVALPCGLIVTELVSNSLKHGYPEGRSGDIVVSLAREAPNRIVLEVFDDGVGLPPGFDPSKAETLGLQLVYGLTAQLAGDVRFTANGRLVWRVSFPYSQGAAEPPAASNPMKRTDP